MTTDQRLDDYLSKIDKDYAEHVGMNPMLARKANDLKEMMRGISKYGGVGVADGAKGALIGYMNEYFGGDDQRHIVLAWLFGSEDKLKMSTKELTDGQWYALSWWVDSRQDDGVWDVGPVFAVESGLVLTEALKRYHGRDREQAQDNPSVGLIETAVGDLGGTVVMVGDDQGNFPQVNVKVEAEVAEKKEIPVKKSKPKKKFSF